MDFGSENFDIPKTAFNPSEGAFEEGFIDLDLSKSKNLFFVQSDSVEQFDKIKEKNVSKPELKIMGKRLNSFDSQLLEDTSYIKLTDENLKLENQIERAQKSVKEIDEQITIASTFNNKTLLYELNKERQEALNYLEDLKKEYRQKSPENKFTENIAAIFSKVEDGIGICKNFYDKHIFQPVFSNPILPLSKNSKLKSILTRLNALNKNVDELSSLRIPYGEQEARYNILAQYLTQASVVHSLIKKEMDELH